MLLSIYHLRDTARVNARREQVTAGTLVIGSWRGCDVVIGDDALVEPRHVQLVIEGSALLVEPIAGTTRINNVVVVASTIALISDAIQVGDTVLKLRPDPVVLVAPTPPPPPLLPPPPPIPVRPLAAGNPPRPSFLLDVPRRPPPPRPIWRTVLSATPVEQGFLETLRDQPADTVTRMVYADWLEGRGEVERAAFVRLELRCDDPAIVANSDIDWRAITNRTPIEDCRVGQGDQDPDAPQCPARWDALDASDDERMRRCAVCSRRVRFCASLDDARLAGQTGEHAVFDVALDDSVAYGVFHGGPLDAPSPARPREAEPTLELRPSRPVIARLPPVVVDPDPISLTDDDPVTIDDGASDRDRR